VSSSNWLGSFWLPQSASPATSGQDNLFYLIYGLSVFFFVIIVGFIVYFAWRYRSRKENTETTHIHGNTKLEIVWSVIPSVLFVIIFAWGFYGWLKLNTVPENPIEVRVTARKWDWLFTDVKTGAEMSDLIVPVNTPVRLVMSSVDVIHGFYAPNFRINRDVLPSQYTTVWFQATEIGSYPVLCTQYCGTKHSQMIRYVKVMPPEEYKKAIIAAQGAGLSPAELGKKIFAGKGACASCHDVSSDKKRVVGPPLFGAFGRKQKITLPNGTKQEVVFDENYFRQSLINPNFRVIDGYPSVMPTYQGQLTDKEIEALTQYIKSLK
jgi:cytochrome c oxidase subunit 2